MSEQADFYFLLVSGDTQYVFVIMNFVGEEFDY